MARVASPVFSRHWVADGLQQLHRYRRDEGNRFATMQRAVEALRHLDEMKRDIHRTEVDDWSDASWDEWMDYQMESVEDSILHLMRHV